MFKPSEYLTLELVPVELAPIDVVVKIDGEGTGLSTGILGLPVKEGQSPVSDDEVSNVPFVKEQIKQQDTDKVSVSCPPIDFPKLTEQTECLAVRKNGNIKLSCGEHTIDGIHTLKCMFDQLPKGVYRALY